MSAHVAFFVLLGWAVLVVALGFVAIDAESLVLRVLSGTCSAVLFVALIWSALASAEESSCAAHPTHVATEATS